MKKVISILLLIVFVFSLAACKKEGNTSSELDKSVQSDISSAETSTESITASKENSTNISSANTTPSNSASSNNTPSKIEEPKPTVVAGEYTVTFDYGYDNIKTTAKSKNYKVAKPETPKRLGYKFEGWYANDEDTPWSFSGHVVTENITLTAKWIQQDISIGRHIGCEIISISEDSDLYGKANSGDIITQVNGIDIIDDSILLDIIKESKPGDKISLTIISVEETQKTTEVELTANAGDSNSAKLGITCTFINSIENKVNNDFDFPFGE